MNKPITLHDGLTLPPGTRIGFLCKAMQRDSSLFDDALRFNGERWLRLNTEAAKSTSETGADSKDGVRYTASMTSTTHLP